MGGDAADFNLCFLSPENIWDNINAAQTSAQKNDISAFRNFNKGAKINLKTSKIKFSYAKNSLPDKHRN